MKAHFLVAVLVLSFSTAANAVHADRVKETTVTTGAGNVTLAGAIVGFRTFNSAVGVGPTFPYAIVHRGAAEWEMGTAVLTNATTLVRTVQSSSNANALVSFSSGTKDVFLTPTAATFDGFCAVDGSTVITGNFVFEGSVADTFETTFVITNPTADRSITFKDGTGTVAFTSDIVNMSAADILAALITVDGAGSGLDADLLDGSSSAAFAVVAGGNTFAASNNYAANDITDVDVVDTITASNYCALAGCTMTGALSGTNGTFTGSVDVQSVIRNTAGVNLEVDEANIRGTAGLAITTQNNGDVSLVPGGTGDVVIRTGTDNLTRVLSNAGTEVGTIDTGTFNFMIGYTGLGLNDGAIRWNDVASANWGVNIGNMSAVGPTLQIVRVSEAMTTTPVDYFAVWGDGAHGVPATGQQQITIADNAVGASAPTDTTSPVSSRVEVTCNDVDGCIYSPGETNAQDGWQNHVCNVSAANVVTLTESAGFIRVRGAATTIALNTMDCAACVYTGTEWGCF